MTRRWPWREAAAALLLVATYLNPTLPLQRPRVEQIVVLDVTQSMNVVDQVLDGRPVSRLAFAKAALQRALEALPCGSKLGWAIFTDNRSYLLSTPIEVCRNRAELRGALAAIDGRMAWSGNSEIAKGLHSGFVVAKALPEPPPALVFVTDGQEAPPLNPRHRPAFDDKPGEVAGLLVGVGGLAPQPIPKTDPVGRPLGFWGADEVMQVDPRSFGRGASVGGEAMAEDGSAPAAGGLGATPGREHLSALREPYLQLLAGENGLAYLRLHQVDDLAPALRDPKLARAVPVKADARPGLAALACVLLLWPAWHGLRARWPRLRWRLTGAKPAAR